MKKFSVSLLAISFFILTLFGCNTNTEPLKLVTAFEATAVISTSDITMKVQIISVSADDVSIVVQAPENLKGLEYHKVNSTLYIDYDGLKCTTASDYLTFFNPFEVIFDAVECITLARPDSTKSGNETLVFTSETLNGEVVFYTDKEGNIIKILPQYTDCEIDLSY